LCSILKVVVGAVSPLKLHLSPFETPKETSSPCCVFMSMNFSLPLIRVTLSPSNISKHFASLLTSARSSSDSLKFVGRQFIQHADFSVVVDMT
jgi:hypothetical protein